MPVALLFGMMVAVAEPMPEVPPPPPLPIRVQAEVGWSPINAWLTAILTKPVVEPFDGGGQTSSIPAPLDPALLSILRQWSEFNEPTRRLRVRLSLYIYDADLGHETRLVGELLSENDSSRFDLRPPRTLPAGGVNSSRRDRQGQPYRVAAGPPTSYIVKGRSVTILDDERKTYTECDGPIPFVNAWGESVASAFRPFQVEQRMSTFSISPGSQHEPKGRAHLRLEGLGKKWREEYQSVEIMLDPESRRPAAMKIVSKLRARETVYVFEEVAHGGRYDLWSGDPFQVDRANYTVISQDLKFERREAEPTR